MISHGYGYFNFHSGDNSVSDQYQSVCKAPTGLEEVSYTYAVGEDNTSCADMGGTIIESAEECEEAVNILAAEGVTSNMRDILIRWTGFLLELNADPMGCNWYTFWGAG